MGELHVWQVNDGENFLIVAMDEADVVRVLDECGFEPDEHADTRTIKRLPLEQLVTVNDEEDGSCTQPCEQWIAKHGRGLLGSTVY